MTTRLSEFDVLYDRNVIRIDKEGRSGHYTWSYECGPQEMHYPTQLQLLETLKQLRVTKESLSYVNATWPRSWHMKVFGLPRG